MSLETYPQKASEPESWEELIVFTGASTATPTLNFGKGVTLGRTGAGITTITFKDSPGNLCGAGGQFVSALMTDLKNFSVVVAPMDTTGKICTLTIFNSSGTATDLTSVQQLSLSLTFKRAQITL